MKLLKHLIGIAMARTDTKTQLAAVAAVFSVTVGKNKKCKG